MSRTRTGRNEASIALVHAHAERLICQRGVGTAAEKYHHQPPNL